jgi:peptidoglycan/LPS O-acetylase OafA/YrhL
MAKTAISRPNKTAAAGLAHTRSPGLDALRLAALLLVTAQHAFSLTGHLEWLTLHDVNAGTAGVALFIAISGFLAGCSRQPPAEWLFRRLVRVYPAYWIVMAGCFVLARATGYKPFGPGQVASQMLGTGLFTHGEQLVNVPTWFISLLLACYLGLFLLRLLPWPRIALLLAAAPLAWWEAGTDYLGRLIHFPTFFAAAAVAAICPARHRPLGLALAGAAFLLRAPWSMGCFYTGATLLAVGAVLGWRRAPLWPVPIAEYSYEYYLVHGVFLVAAVKLLPDQPAAAIALGVVLSALAALLLRRFVLRLGAAWPAFRKTLPQPERSG